MNTLKRELQQALNNTRHPDLLLGTMAGIIAWTITTILRLLFGS